MKPSRGVESDRFGWFRTVGDRIADRWCRLDRGWQAMLLGLGIVVVQLLVQAV
jgi:hypothetical protein